MSLDNDFEFWFAGDILLQQREVELLDAHLVLKRWQSLTQVRKGVALSYAKAEVERYKARIESLELSIQTIKGNTNNE